MPTPFLVMATQNPIEMEGTYPLPEAQLDRFMARTSIGYPDRIVRVPRGWSVLEASRSHRIAHISMCGGRARCSTCRVRVVAGEEQCPPPAEDERRTLMRIHAAEGTRRR